MRLSCSLGVATCKVVAKIGSDARKPGGITVVPAGGEAAFLAPLAVRALPGVGPKAQRRLEEAGVVTIGALAGLDDGRLGALRPGRVGLELRRRAQGIDARPVLAEPAEAVSISNEETFATDIGDREVLHAYLRTMATALAGSLERRGMTARTVTTKLRYPDFAIVTRSQSLDVGIDDAETIGSLACELLRPGAAHASRAHPACGRGRGGVRPPQAARCCRCSTAIRSEPEPSGSGRAAAPPGGRATGSTRGSEAASAGTSAPYGSSPGTRALASWARAYSCLDVRDDPPSALDREVHPRVLGQREEVADLVRRGSARGRGSSAVAREPFDGRLAGAQHDPSCLGADGIGMRVDEILDLEEQCSAETVHGSSSSGREIRKAWQAGVSRQPRCCASGRRLRALPQGDAKPVGCSLRTKAWGFSRVPAPFVAKFRSQPPSRASVHCHNPQLGRSRARLAGPSLSRPARVEAFCPCAASSAPPSACCGV